MFVEVSDSDQEEVALIIDEENVWDANEVVYNGTKQLLNNPEVAETGTPPPQSHSFIPFEPILPQNCLAAPVKTDESDEELDVRLGDSQGSRGQPFSGPIESQTPVIMLAESHPDHEAVGLMPPCSTTPFDVIGDGLVLGSLDAAQSHVSEPTDPSNLHGYPSFEHDSCPVPRGLPKTISPGVSSKDLGTPIKRALDGQDDLERKKARMIATTTSTDDKPELQVCVDAAEAMHSNAPGGDGAQRVEAKLSVGEPIFEGQSPCAGTNASMSAPATKDDVHESKPSAEVTAAEAARSNAPVGDGIEKVEARPSLGEPIFGVQSPCEGTDASMSAPDSVHESKPSAEMTAAEAARSNAPVGDGAEDAKAESSSGKPISKGSHTSQERHRQTSREWHAKFISKGVPRCQAATHAASGTEDADTEQSITFSRRMHAWVADYVVKRQETWEGTRKELRAKAFKEWVSSAERADLLAGRAGLI